MATADVQVRASVVDFVNKNFLMGASLQFGDSDSFMEKGIVDSTGVLEMVAFLQRTFGITVTDEELVPDNLDSVKSITAYVCRKMSGS